MIDEVLPRIYRIEVPLPHSPLKNLNSYVIKGDGRCLIIDTGWKREECLDAMQAGLERLNVDLARADFFITHIHADHLGLVGKLATKTSTVYFNKPEAAINNLEHPEVRWHNFGVVYRSNGFPEKELQWAMEKHPSLLYNLRQRFDFSILKEHDILNIGDYSFRCIETPGHSPGHICLYDAARKVLVAGDHILGTITPNIAYWPELDNPLKHYLASLEKVEPLDVEVVLPAHRNIFYNFRTRIAELKEHHRARLNQILVALDGTAMTAFDIAPHIKWDIKYASWELFPPSQKWFAMGETISHLRLLEETKQLRRQTRGQQIVFSLT